MRDIAALESIRALYRLLACTVIVGQSAIWAMVTLSDGSPPHSGPGVLGEGPSSLNHPLNRCLSRQNCNSPMVDHR